MVMVVVPAAVAVVVKPGIKAFALKFLLASHEATVVAVGVVIFDVCPVPP
jgi:hypothetical protein